MIMLPIFKKAELYQVNPTKIIALGLYTGDINTIPTNLIEPAQPNRIPGGSCIGDISIRR